MKVKKVTQPAKVARSKIVKAVKKTATAKPARKTKAGKQVARALKVGMISEAEVISRGFGGCKAVLPGGEVVWVPASQTSWTRPVTVPAIGESIRVKLIERNEQGFRASMKVLVPDPFGQKFCVIHDIGDVLPATVRSANITGVGVEFGEIPGVYGSLIAGEVGRLLKAGGLPSVGSEIKVRIEEFNEPTRNVRVSLVEMPEVLEKPNIADGWRAFTSGDPSAVGTGTRANSPLGFGGVEYGQLLHPDYIVADASNLIGGMLTDEQRAGVLPGFAEAVERFGSIPVLFVKTMTLAWLRKYSPKSYGKVSEFCKQRDKVVLVEAGSDDDDEILAFLASHEKAIGVSKDRYRNFTDRYGEIIRTRVVPWTGVLGIPGSRGKVRIPKLGIEFEL